MKQVQSLKVAIDASDILCGPTGGVAQFSINLISELGKLYDGSETYTIIVKSQQQLNWLKPLLGQNQQALIKTQHSDNKKSFSDLLKGFLGPFLPTARYVQKLINIPRYWPEVPISDGFYENLGCSAVHFLNQFGFTLCALPTVYNPHDIQHLHYPQFFTPSTLALRETIYPAGCHFAHTVVAGSQWIKDDLVQHYQIYPDKVQVIPEAPPTHLNSEPSQKHLSVVKNKYQLQQPFAFYPAVTWPHKNHIHLLEALAYLRDAQQFTVRLVCSGSLFKDFWPSIEKCIAELHLESQVKFLGFVPDEELRALYRLSQFLVLPTLFEAVSLPIFEAWWEGIPVTCSNVTALPDQVREAALLFDPHSTESIANAVAKMATSAELRQELQKSGCQRVQDFDWQRTAKAYRAVYRRAARFPLTEEDRHLLSWDWMREPKKKNAPL